MIMLVCLFVLFVVDLKKPEGGYTNAFGSYHSGCSTAIIQKVFAEHSSMSLCFSVMSAQEGGLSVGPIGPKQVSCILLGTGHFLEEAVSRCPSPATIGLACCSKDIQSNGYRVAMSGKIMGQVYKDNASWTISALMCGVLPPTTCSLCTVPPATPSFS